ncbi:MAG: class I SAM-dependent methyltransferase [Opitutus sp.]
MSFETLAPHYTWMEKVLAGGRLQRSRTAWLNELAGCKRILIAGVGHGHFLRVCAQRFPQAHFVSVDESDGMLAHARRGFEDDPRFSFIHASLPRWRPAPRSFDAVATHFFLDCFPPEELREVVDSLANGLTDRARWLVTDFSVPASGWRRQRARAIHLAMYTFFRPVTGIRARRVTPPDALLRHHGFELSGRTHRDWGLIQSDIWTRGSRATCSGDGSMSETTDNTDSHG